MGEVSTSRKEVMKELLKPLSSFKPQEEEEKYMHVVEGQLQRFVLELVQEGAWVSAEEKRTADVAGATVIINRDKTLISLDGPVAW